ncbi:hypothetical protein HU200_026499 [Digitaria exilis]|uniref:Uncharacterized protein n=1 Tax=Digitaria exilis TaxID=1010633 RepID=A0A835BYA8_9POAL|nr:hypothetical protein HU200_026499 [Digitaria exilis]CAB3464467.1 unnamed protein product [Digitaria exilis]
MLGRRRGSSSSKSREPNTTGTAVAVAAENSQGVTISQFIMQLDESATKRLHRMNERLRLLEQQMETLETDVAKARSHSASLEGCTE